MQIKKIFIKKIFSLKFKVKFFFSKKDSPEERLTNLIDEIIGNAKKSQKHPSKKIKLFDNDYSKKMISIHEDYLQGIKTSNESLNPEARLKAFTKRMKKTDKQNPLEFMFEKGNNKSFEENELSDSDSKKTKIENSTKINENPIQNNEKLSEKNDSPFEEFLKTFKNKMDEQPKANDKSEEKISTKQNENTTKEKENTTKEKEKVEQNEEEKFFEGASKGLNYIPKNLIIKTMVFPKNNAEVLLLGVEKRNDDHALFMIDLLTKLKIDNIVTQIAPDEPFFIKTEDSYRIAWLKFLKGKFEYKFIINPNPINLADLILDANRLKFLIDGSFMKSSEDFEMGSNFFYSKRPMTNKLEVDCFLTPFLYSYNNVEKTIPIIVNDFPIILYREYIVRHISMSDLKQLYASYLEEEQKGNKNFDPALIKPDIFIEPKIEYLTEVIKQSCFLGKKILAIVDMNCAEFIAEKWKNSPELNKIQSLQKILKDKKLQNDNDDQLTFTEYIEKHVILDLMLDNFIQENFVDHRSFPFSGENTIGKSVNLGNVFMIWNHYMRKHKGLKSKKPKNLEDLSPSKISEVNAIFEDQSTMTKAMNRLNEKFKIKNIKN